MNRAALSVAFSVMYPTIERPYRSVLGTGSADTGLIIVLFSSSIGRGVT